MHFTTLTASAAVLAAVSAYPQYSSYLRSRQGQDDDHSYRAPGPNDARSPCPATNTLANHGFIPRDGKNVSRQDFLDGFLQGWGMDNTSIATGIFNTFQICAYIMGEDCGETIPNITILDEPHTFEHDHSMSRNDYHMAYNNGGITNNANFNSTVFQSTLDVIGDVDHVDYSQMNLARLTRESLSIQQDYPSWFSEAIPVTMFEVGFIYAIMSDFNLPDYATTPKVRMDWWKYWFTNESFPTPLGWHKPDPPKGGDYCKSVSAAVMTASISSTPSPLGPAPFTGGFVESLPAQATVPILPLPTEAPYVGPGPLRRRDARPTAVPQPAGQVAKVASIKSSLGPQPTLANPYVDQVDAEHFRRKQAYYLDRAAKIDAALAS